MLARYISRETMIYIEGDYDIYRGRYMLECRYIDEKCDIQIYSGSKLGPSVTLEPSLETSDIIDISAVEHISPSIYIS